MRDKQSGKSKGYAFLCYEDQRSTVLSVDNLNGIKVNRKIVKIVLPLAKSVSIRLSVCLVITLLSRTGVLERMSGELYMCIPCEKKIHMVPSDWEEIFDNGPFSAFFNDFEIFNGPFLITLHRL